ncbi:site-specific integrase [Zavarzinella formosa]|uniref:site-specific integrase n=1 Tax=Zavarzinella formosa TaxID=360055 RepID=UPI000370DD5B|nr:site-specific integrase [Zavarzinella formosa]
MTAKSIRITLPSGFDLPHPFEDVIAGTMANPGRQFFDIHEDRLKLIEAAPTAEWRALIALARFGGLRILSEIIPLTWPDFLWNRGWFRVTSPKTAHHEGKGERLAPIFPELKPRLDELFEQATPGQVSVFTSFRSGDNLRTSLTRLIRKAGLTPWKRLFQNLRNSRETELVDVFPSHAVTTWIGNSHLIAVKYYLQVRDSDFDRAVKGIAHTAGAKSGAFEERTDDGCCGI